MQSGANQATSLIAGRAEIKVEDGLILYNLKYFDHTQGQNFPEWEQEGLLAEALDTLKGYSTRRMNEVLGKREPKFTCYGSFPSGCKKFRHPKHVPPDAKWTRIHVNGTRCIIGHIVGNVFYLVFLDKDHEFWPTDIQDR
jgi:hypothetical protein